MTFQERDAIFYKRKPYQLLSYLTCPEKLLEDNKDDPSWGSVDSSNWKGYYVSWEIQGDKLYLKSVVGQKKAKVKLPCLFQYTGDVAIPTGEWLERLDDSSYSIYEKELHFDIVKGIVTKTHEVINGMPADLKTKCLHCMRLLSFQEIINDEDGSLSPHKCPICSSPMGPPREYPKTVCRSCVQQAIDKSGRLLKFSYDSLRRGLCVTHRDDDSRYKGHFCYIHKKKCKAELVHSLRRIVVQLVEEK